MGYLYKLDHHKRTNQLRCPIPAFLRESIFLDSDIVKITNRTDAEGDFMIVRPVKKVH